MVGQVWRIVYDDGRPPDRCLLLLVSETRRPDGGPWYWTAVELESGRTQTVQLQDQGASWRWARYA